MRATKLPPTWLILGALALALIVTAASPATSAPGRPRAAQLSSRLLAVGTAHFSGEAVVRPRGRELEVLVAIEHADPGLYAVAILNAPGACDGLGEGAPLGSRSGAPTDPALSPASLTRPLASSLAGEAHVTSLFAPIEARRRPVLGAHLVLAQAAGGASDGVDRTTGAMGAASGYGAGAGTTSATATWGLGPQRAPQVRERASTPPVAVFGGRRAAQPGTRAATTAQGGLPTGSTPSTGFAGQPTAGPPDGGVGPIGRDGGTSQSASAQLGSSGDAGTMPPGSTRPTPSTQAPAQQTTGSAATSFDRERARDGEGRPPPTPSGVRGDPARLSQVGYVLVGSDGRGYLETRFRPAEVEVASFEALTDRALVAQRTALRDGDPAANDLMGCGVFSRTDGPSGAK